jgi:hypothetical protein
MNTKSGFAALLVALALTACDIGPKSGRGFRLPGGDPEKGKAAFVSLQCHTCHQVAGVDLPAPPSKAPINFLIGGDVTRLHSYGELVTSIINPSHGLSRRFDKKQMEESKLSPMPEFNHLMTVGQMIDLVAFLHPRYTKLDPAPYYFMP